MWSFFNNKTMKALLIIDIQNDFLPGGSLAVAKGDKIISIVNKIQKHFDLVIATQDWHPSNHKSFASNHNNKAVFEVIKLNGSDQVLWPDHCIQGSFGADFSTELNMHQVSAVIRKGTNLEIDSYSGFFDNNKQNATGLHGLLKEKNITEVYVCGLAADYCVYYTAKDAAELGYKTYFIEDATKPISEENYDLAKEDLASLSVIFTDSSKL